MRATLSRNKEVGVCTHTHAHTHSRKHTTLANTSGPPHQPLYLLIKSALEQCKWGEAARSSTLCASDLCVCERVRIGLYHSEAEGSITCTYAYTCTNAYTCMQVNTLTHSLTHSLTTHTHTHKRTKSLDTYTRRNLRWRKKRSPNGFSCGVS